MDAAQYFDAKTANAIDIRKVSSEMYVAVIKQWNPATGVEANPQVISFTKANLMDDLKTAQKALAQAQKGVDGLNEMLKDLDALDAK